MRDPPTFAMRCNEYSMDKQMNTKLIDIHPSSSAMCIVADAMAIEKIY